MKKVILFLGAIVIAFIFFNCNPQSQKQPNDKVLIGVIPALTGDASIYGLYYDKGVELAIEEQNKKGGLLGKKIESVVFDSQSKKDEATKAIGLILDKNPVAVFAHLSPACLAIKTQTEKKGTIFIASSGAEKLLDSAKYVIRNYVDPNLTGEVTAEKIKNILGIDKIGIFYCTDEYGLSIFQRVENGCKNFDIKILFSSPFNLKDNDYKTLIKKYVNNNIEYIHVIGYGPSLGNLIRQIKDSGYAGIIGGDVTIAGKDTKEAAGKSIKGVYYLDYDFQTDINDSVRQDFMLKYNKYTGDPIDKNPFSMFVLGYEGAYLFFDAVKNKNTLNTDSVFSEILHLKKQGVFCPIEVINKNVVYKLKFNQITEQ